MSELLERITAHATEQTRPVIEVPEWGDENGPLKIYVRPLSMEQVSLLELSSAKDKFKALVDLIVMKAEREDGARVFQAKEKAALMSVADSELVIRVAEEIGKIVGIATKETDEAAAEGN